MAALNHRYGMCFNASGDPESQEDSEDVRQWNEYVRSALDKEGITYSGQSWSLLWFDDEPFEESTFPQTLLSDDFELKYFQYGLRIYVKRITGPPPTKKS